MIAGGAQISVLQGGLACAVVADQEIWRLPVQDSGFAPEFAPCPDPDVFHDLSCAVHL